MVVRMALTLRERIPLSKPQPAPRVYFRIRLAPPTIVAIYSLASELTFSR